MQQHLLPVNHAATSCPTDQVVANPGIFYALLLFSPECCQLRLSLSILRACSASRSFSCLVWALLEELTVLALWVKLGPCSPLLSPGNQTTSNMGVSVHRTDVARSGSALPWLFIAPCIYGLKALRLKDALVWPGFGRSERNKTESWKESSV